MLDDAELATPKHQVEHEAYVTLLAERAGVRVPRVFAAREVPGGAAVLVRRRVDGERIATLSPDDLDDALLKEIWQQIAALGDANIAHSDLSVDNIVVDRDGKPWITDFTHGRAVAGRVRTDQDVAEALVSLAVVVGPERTVRSAVEVLGSENLARSLFYLQLLALPKRIRRQLRGRRDVLAQLQAEVADVTGATVPSFRVRVRPTTLIGLAVLGGAVYILLPQLGTLPEMVTALRGSSVGWLVVAAVASAMTFPFATVGYIGAAPWPLPFWKTTAVQVASAFTSRLTPAGLGGIGLNVIYLERVGNVRREAVGAVALNQTAGAIVHAVGFFGAVAIVGRHGMGGVELPTGWPVLVAVVVAFVGIGLLLGSPFGRRRIVRPGIEVARQLVQASKRPLKATALFGGSAGVTAANAVALIASLAAFDATMSPFQVAAVYVAGSAIASPAPTPGALGAVEAALVAGLTGIGVATAPAVAGVLAFRLLTFWVPMLPGLYVFRYLQSRNVV